MPKILNPTIKVPNIKLTIDPHIEGVSNNILQQRGNTVPLLQFGERVIDWSNIEKFRLEVGYTSSFNVIPTIDLLVDDSEGFISTYITNNPDIGICRYGYKDWGIRFIVLYNSVTNKGNMLRMSGTLYTDYLYNDVGQTSFKDKSISDIIQSLCSKCGLGMFTYDNNDITQSKDYIVNGSMSYINLMSYIINKYTSNIWCMDPNYFLHIGDMKSIINQNTATYTLSQIDYELMDKPKKMIFLSKPFDSKDDGEDDFKIPCDYTFDKQYTDRYVKLASSYRLYDNEGVRFDQTSTFGLGDETSNTFSGFVSHINPFTHQLIAKDLSKQIIKLTTNNIIPELNPFDVVECELYRGIRLVDQDTNPIDGSELPTSDLDTEHSGKKVVLGYTVEYVKKDDLDENTRRMYQHIYVI